MKIFRFIISICCSVTFFGLIIAEYTGHLTKDVPSQVYAFLMAIALLGPEATFDKASRLVDMIWGKK